MTEWMWLKNLNMMENWLRRKLTWWTWPKNVHNDENDRVNMTENWEYYIFTHNNENDRVNMTKNLEYNIFFSFGQLQSCIFVIVNFFFIIRSTLILFFRGCGKINNIFFFQSNSIAFGQAQQINVRHCHFSVMF